MNHSEFAATYPSPFQMAPEFNFDQLELNLKESRESPLQSKKDMEEIERIIHQWNPGIIQSNQQQQQQFYYQSYIQEDCISYSQQLPYFENPNPHSQIDQYQTNLYQLTPPFTSDWSNPSYYYSFTNPYEYSFYPHDCSIQATSCISDWEFQSQASFSTPQSTSMWIPSVPFSFSDRATQIIAILNSTYGSQQQISTIAMTEVVNESSLVRPDLCGTESKLMGGEDTTCLCEVGGNYEINKENYCKNRVDFRDERMGSEVFSVMVDDSFLSPQQIEIVVASVPSVRQNVQEEDHGVNLGEILKTSQCKIHDPLHVSVLCEEKESTVQKSWFPFSMSATKSDIEPLAYDVRGVEKFAEQVEFIRVGDRDLFLGNQLGLVHDSLHYHEFCAVNFDKLLVGETRTNGKNLSNSLSMVLSVVPQNAILTSNPKPPWHLFDKSGLNLVIVALSGIEEKETVRACLVLSSKHQSELADIHVQSRATRHTRCIRDMVRAEDLTMEFYAGVYGNDGHMPYLEWDPGPQSGNMLAGIILGNWPSQHRIANSSPMMRKLALEEIGGESIGKMECCYTPHSKCGLQLRHQLVDLFGGFALVIEGQYIIMAETIEATKTKSFKQETGFPYLLAGFVYSWVRIKQATTMVEGFNCEIPCLIGERHQLVTCNLVVLLEFLCQGLKDVTDLMKVQFVEESHRLDKIEEADCWIPVYSRSRPSFFADTKEQTLTFDEVIFRKLVQHNIYFLILDPDDGTTWLLLLMEDEYWSYMFLDDNWGFVGKLICFSRCLPLDDLSFRPLLVEIYRGSGLQLNCVLDRDYIWYRRCGAANLVITVERVYKMIEERTYVVASNFEGDIFYAHQSNFFATQELLMVTLKSQFAVFDRGKIRRQQVAQFNGDSKDAAAYVADHLHRCFFFNLEDKVASTGEELIRVKWVNKNGVDQAQIELGAMT